MSLRTTRKSVMNSYNNVISVSYCGLQHLLSMEQKIAHTERAEGWGADIYHFGNTAIVTGYAPFGNVKPSSDIVREFDKRAERVFLDFDFCDYQKSMERRREKLSRLISEFIETVTE